MSIGNAHPVEPEVIEIRKYSNRRLYDTSASRYVTLQHVKQMIRQGKEIQVVDAQTGEDLTRAVMLQIICESKSQQELLPVSFLRQVIQASGKTVQSSIKDFLSLGLHAQKDLHQQLSHWMRMGVAMNPFMSTFASMFSNESQPSSQGVHQQPFGTPGDPSEAEDPTTNAAMQHSIQDKPSAASVQDKPSTENVESEIEELRHQLAFMQQQIDKLGEKQ